MQSTTESRRASMPTFLGLLALTLCTGSMTACKPDPALDEGGDTETGDGDGDPGDGDGDGDGLAATYWQEVAPIYYDSCVSCHREGGIGPFVLDDYDSAAAWAQASAIAVENRVMPPWLVTDDGTCNSWQHSRALSQADIDTILAWVEAGAPEGEPRDDLEVPTLPGLEGATAFVTPEFTPEPEGGFLSEFDEYRCFLIDPELDHDQFITAYEVIPGNEALVHHVLAIPIDPAFDVGGGMTNLDVIEALDAESPDRLGWSCFGAAGDGVAIDTLPVTWAPGQGVVEFPANSGTQASAGDLLVVQVHYNMVDPEVIGQSDSTTVKIRFEDEVAREGLFDVPDALLDSLFEGDPYMIPPGEPAHDFTWSFPADWYIGWNGTTSLELWGFFPHMHAFGTQMKVRVLDEQGQEVGCVGDVQRWDFNWQLYYFMEQPIVLQPGYQIEVTCTYDTTDASEPISPGWGTYNEMCLAGVYLVEP
ncbi:conserved hypothetical protein-putative thiol-disulfide isomerase or thioredoxin [Enhygromyxa salina]|uniref:Cytochrome c domain-containing protein n=1 Tax=Enhygromyxa salina TaxID=215803 RepID=A0A0C2CRC3_9BACT|nr:hypothetical protein [Enhygromyxa salina]KIG13706.1 conserved hypothetical protein-putative thiol-disulfide isomerase or thioredoxin [Enhygromyxa salina]